MRRGEIGSYEVTITGDEQVRSFIPLPLPPQPRLVLDGPLQQTLEAALLALGRLDGVTTLLPDQTLFLYTYVRKEAVLSSQIEGTQSSLSDLLLFELEEAPGVPLDDVVEVSNYVAALEHGLSRLKVGFPLSNRLLREIHGVCCCLEGVVARRRPASFAVRRTGLAARGLATLTLCRRRIASCPTAWPNWNASSTPERTGCPCYCALASLTCSSRPFTLSLTATDVSADCW